ncbi:MAG: aldehyde dehydrogenase family protein [Eubacteriales bacterium]|nr:aldehyde dehydrogenase family protein [Eubacteriales bacterium]
MENEQYISSLIGKAREAQRQLENYTQEQVDVLVRITAKIVFDNADILAKMAAEETRMGVYEHKIKKNEGKARILWNHMKGKKSVGILRYLRDEGLVEIAKPKGVIGAVTPCTNPIVTPMCNAMYAIKGRNAIIIAPHPRAKKCARFMVDLYDEAFAKLGAPKNIIQVVDEPSIELTGMLMKAVDVVIATGGMGMVKAAYSSGKPSFGVGAGNVQCIIDRDVDFEEVAKKVIEGRAFDNGLICSGEQTIIAHRDDLKKVIDAFRKAGAYYTEDKEELDRIRNVVFPEGAMNKDVVGQPIDKIARLCGIDIPEGTRVIIVKPEKFGTGDYFSKEKMCPLMSAYTYDTWEAAVDIAHQNLLVEGKGHTVAIHSNNEKNVEYAGLVLPVSRLLINQIGATMNGGSFVNGLNPTTTLGCGSWGNNSISENLDYTHLFNVSRIAYVKQGARQPSDEEIWG